ncbi:hypothetical protein HYC85_025038 [Camellia sinensis]|uniref:RRM domain-containing protein n=1 Tax=Camellia sinensis TaxID=4442 RepID=A0A7J7G9T4_CAMSI|nr:hypothetical protein HYC85_025038 [Camellia sinensis]
MDSSDEAKIFIGGIAWETTEEKLKEHFSNYGEVTQTVVMRDKITGRPRGFGFVLFSDPSVLHSVLHDTHSIDGRTVEAKRVLPREEQRTSSRPGHPNTGRSFEGTGNYKTKKIFVGGLPSTLTEEGFRQYFETYGNVTDVVIMYDQNTNRPRGFGFITFDTEDAVDRVLHKNFHELNNKLVEVKPALPKEANPGSGGGGGGRGGGHQPYGSSGANASTFDARMDGGRFMQPQTAGGGAYAPYPTYGGPNYGYGAANSTVGYGGYGGYGAGGYGSANIGFTGPAGAYGNPSAANAGYVSGPAGALKAHGATRLQGMVLQATVQMQGMHQVLLVLFLHQWFHLQVGLLGMGVKGMVIIVITVEVKALILILVGVPLTAILVATMLQGGIKGQVAPTRRIQILPGDQTLD